MQQSVALFTFTSSESTTRNSHLSTTSLSANRRHQSFWITSKQKTKLKDTHNSCTLFKRTSGHQHFLLQDLLFNPVMQRYFVFILLSSRHNKSTCLPVFCNHRLLQFTQCIFVMWYTKSLRYSSSRTPLCTFIGHRLCFFFYNRGSITF